MHPGQEARRSGGRSELAVRGDGWRALQIVAAVRPSLAVTAGRRAPRPADRPRPLRWRRDPGRDPVDMRDRVVHPTLAVLALAIVLMRGRELRAASAGLGVGHGGAKLSASLDGGSVSPTPSRGSLNAWSSGDAVRRSGAATAGGGSVQATARAKNRVQRSFAGYGAPTKIPANQHKIGLTEVLWRGIFKPPFRSRPPFLRLTPALNPHIQALPPAPQARRKLSRHGRWIWPSSDISDRHIGSESTNWPRRAKPVVR